MPHMYRIVVTGKAVMASPTELYDEVILTLGCGLKLHSIWHQATNISQ